jgi:hypothetical protein
MILRFTIDHLRVSRVVGTWLLAGGYLATSVDQLTVWRRDRDPARSSRAVKEDLATLDDKAWGAASDVVPKFISPSDPAAQGTGAHKGRS